MPKSDTQFKPGQSGNPSGRPKSKVFSDTARELMAAEDLDVTWNINGKVKKLKLSSTKSMHYGIVSALIMEALKGNVTAARELVDRVEGKPIQSNEISGPDGGPIETEANELFARLLEAAARKVAEDAGGGEGEPT